LVKISPAVQDKLLIGTTFWTHGRTETDESETHVYR